MSKQTIEQIQFNGAPGHPYVERRFDKIYPLKHCHYRFELTPETFYWGFGLRLSKGKDFPPIKGDSTEKLEGYPALIIHVKELILDTDQDPSNRHNKFVFRGEGLNVAGIQLEDVYRQPAQLTIRDDKGTLFIDTGTNLNTNHSTRMDLGEYRYFEIFGFGEQFGFDFHCDVIEMK